MLPPESSDDCGTMSWPAPVVAAAVAIQDAIASSNDLQLVAPRGAGATTLLRHVAAACGVGDRAIECYLTGPSTVVRDLRRWFNGPGDITQVVLRDRGGPDVRVPGGIVVVTVCEPSPSRVCCRTAVLRPLSRLQSERVLRKSIQNVGGRDSIVSAGATERLIERSGGLLQQLSWGLRSALTQAVLRSADRVEPQDLNAPATGRYRRAA